MSLEALKSFFNEGEGTDKGKDKEKERRPDNAVLTAYIREDKERMDYYKMKAENINKSEMLRSKINKAFINEVDPIEILKDCLECISVMTGDTVSYNQNIKKLKEMTSQNSL